MKWLPLLVAPLLLAACAAGGGSREDAVEPITVAVRNDLRPPTAVTVRLFSDGGARYLLGNVPPQQTRSLPVEVGFVAGEYHLVAEAADGRELRSRTFAAFPFGRVEWTLFSNSLSVQSP
ncbi:MAG TPA: hypothetical protein VFZ18_02705 [Longimicrobiaceae bacterium]